METIHRTQRNFRHLLHAMSYPGDLKILDTTAPYERLYQVNSSLPVPAVYAVMEVVLDGEVKVMTLPQVERFEAELRLYTNTQVTRDLDQAQFLYIHVEDLETKISLSDLASLKVGHLEDPQQSATLVIEVASLVDGASNVSLSGPGIKDFQNIYLPLSSAFLDWRQTMNEEFPLGIDLIIVDAANHCLALPRTTHVTIMKGDA